MNELLEMVVSVQVSPGEAGGCNSKIPEVSPVP